MPEKHCVMCRKNGHTYAECETVPIFDLLAAACNAPAFVGRSPQELAEALKSIEARP